MAHYSWDVLSHRDGVHRPTMRDVADAASVSLKTVSRVVNEEPGVSAETAERVLCVIARLGFRRNHIAHSLRKRVTSTTLGLVIGDLANPFYSTITRAVEEVARQHGYLLIAVSSEENPGLERELITALVQRRVDGLLVVPAAQDQAYLAREVRMGTPVVLLDRPAPGIDADTVVLDNHRGGRLAARHLLRQGHRRIAMIGDLPSIWTANERREGFCHALREAGVEPDPAMVQLGSHDIATAETIAERVLRELRPTAIFAANNRNCIGVLRTVHRLGADVAVVGFDDFELADMLGTPATVISHDPGEMGRSAAELLFGRIAGDDRPPRRVAVPVHLVKRGSGEVPPPAAG